MLSNAYFLAKFRFDRDENESAEILQKIGRICEFTGLPAPRRAVGHDAPELQRVPIAGSNFRGHWIRFQETASENIELLRVHCQFNIMLGYPL